jgi:hypothetical protein
MEEFFNKIVENASNINWQGPAAFVAVFIAVLAFLRKWSMVLMILLTVAIAWGAQDLILFNLESGNEIISVPLLVYAGGGILVFILAFYSFFKSK